MDVFYLALLAVCCGYSLAYGGTPERIAAAIILAAVAATYLVSLFHYQRFSKPEIGIFLVDLAMFAGLLVLAFRADRFWPIAVAACTGVGLMMHAAIWMGPTIRPSVYAMFHAFSAYPTLLILAAGTYRHRRRLKSAGIDRSWSNSSG